MTFNIIYLYKESDWGQELKFSLRGVQKYIPYDTVYVVGDKPEWLVNVVHIDTQQQPNRYDDSNYKFKKALDIIPKDENYLLMHDDFFLLQSYTPICYYDGLMKDAHIGGERQRLFDNQEYSETDKNFAIHYPMPFTYDFEWEYDKPVSLMCALGNDYSQFTNKEVEDCKYHPNNVTESEIKMLPCFSTYNEHEGFERLLLKLYPNKSQFEK